jgi:thiamine biosynthesis protein ThiS
LQIVEVSTKWLGNSPVWVWSRCGRIGRVRLVEPSRGVIMANGEKREIGFPCSVSAILQTAGLKASQVVVELNGSVLRREDVERTVLRNGDRVEIILPVAGG